MSTDNREPIDVESEPVEVQDGGQLALVQTAEINQQIATAKKYPRDIKKFKTECTSLCTLDEEVAGECFYRLERKSQDGGKSVIEGPSSRMAEIVASCWGNCRAAARIIEEGDRFVVAQGAFIDLERNVAITYETRRRITTSKGKRYGDDMIAVTGNAACSIALRNAVFKGVPKAFWSGALEKAKATYRGNEATLTSKRDQWRAYWKKAGAAEERVLATLGKPNWEAVDLDDCMTMRGIATSIKEGDSSIDAAFPPIVPPGDSNKSTADNLAEKLAAKAKDKTEKEQAEAKPDPTPGPASPTTVQTQSAPPSGAASSTLDPASLVAEYRQKAAGCNTIEAVEMLGADAAADERLESLPAEAKMFISDTLQGRMTQIQQAGTKGRRGQRSLVD